MEWLVSVSLAEKLERVFQAEGTAWAKHRGLRQRSQYRWDLTMGNGKAGMR